MGTVICCTTRYCICDGLCVCVLKEKLWMEMLNRLTSYWIPIKKYFKIPHAWLKISQILGV